MGLGLLQCIWLLQFAPPSHLAFPQVALKAIAFPHVERHPLAVCLPSPLDGEVESGVHGGELLESPVLLDDPIWMTLSG